MGRASKEDRRRSQKDKRIIEQCTVPRERDKEVEDSKSERKTIPVVTGWSLTTPRRGSSLVGARVGDEQIVSD